HCWYRHSGQKQNIIWQWITFFGWVDLSILYCAIVVIMVIRKLGSVTKNVDALNSSTSQLSVHTTLINKTMVSSIVRRVVWYPVVPLVAQVFSSLVETFAYINREVSYPLLLLCFIGISIQGLLNALVFSQDIAVTRAFQDIKLHWWITNVNSYESHYPHRSYNKSVTDEFNMLGKSNKWLRYMLLIKLFSPPKSSLRVISLDIISPISTFDGNASNIYSSLVGNGDSKHDITLNNQKNNQDIHLVYPEPVHLKEPSQYSSLDLPSHYLNLSTSSDPLIGNISTRAVSDDKPTTKRVSEDFNKIFGSSQEIEMFKLILK
ncbi:28849_t:CDS:2, partial [Racocetra persica]